MVEPYQARGRGIAHGDAVRNILPCYSRYLPVYLLVTHRTAAQAQMLAWFCFVALTNDNHPHFGGSAFICPAAQNTRPAKTVQANRTTRLWSGVPHIHPDQSELEADRSPDDIHMDVDIAVTG